MKKGFLIVFFVCLWSCDSTEKYSFIVENNSSSPIDISFSVKNKDTLLVIPINKQVLINQSVEVSKPGVDYYLNKQIPLPKNLIIRKNKELLRFNVFNREYWKFENRELNPVYILNLKNNDFTEMVN